jgi:putative oxidoreductase
MAVVLLIGRIIVGLYYVYNAFNHFSHKKVMAIYAGSKNVPEPGLAVIGSGVLLLVGGVSIGFGILPLVGVCALVLFFLVVSFKMHNFWAVEDEREKMTQRIHFMKNMALMGSALMFLGVPTPWPLSFGW